MKKEKLNFSKETISKLQQGDVRGGGFLTIGRKCKTVSTPGPASTDDICYTDDDNACNSCTGDLCNTCNGC